MGVNFNSFIFGKTVDGLAITAHRWENGDQPEVLILAGVHGDETEGVIAAQGLLNALVNEYAFDINLTLVPAFNLDGVLNKNRLNSNGVDLNRNLPSKDWTREALKERYQPGPKPNSEPENQALVTFLKEKNPVFVLSLHSWKPMLNVNGDCTKQAKAIHEITGYSIEESIGYPTPGCLGTYCGLEQNMPTLTYEIERGQKPKEILSMHIPAILSCLKTFNKGDS